MQSILKLTAILLFLLVPQFCWAQTKISQMPNGGATATGDAVPVVRGGVNFQTQFPAPVSPSGSTGFLQTNGGSGSFGSLGIGNGLLSYNGLLNGPGAGVVDPRNEGASCNSLLLSNNYMSVGPYHAVTTTEGSSVITISNFTPNPAVATQTGGGNKGQVITIYASCNPGPTGYVLSATTTSITVGGWPSGAGCSTTDGYALITGYPSDPTNPATAHDDTSAIYNSSVLAVATGSKVFLPNNCAVGQGTAGSETPLQLAPGSLLEGEQGGALYAGAMNDLNNTPTKLYIASTMFPDDSHYGIRTNNPNSANNLQIKIKDFAFTAVGFESFETGYMGACIGDSGFIGLSNAMFVSDHVTYNLCPVGIGVPLGENYNVSFTGQIVGTTLHVTALTPTYMVGTSQSIQWLAKGDQITGTGVPSGETITGVPAGVAGPGGDYGPWLGDYTVSISASTSSEAMTKTRIEGALNFGGTFNQFNDNGIDINGDCSDCWTVGDIHTVPNFGIGIGWYLGPPTGINAGNGANRIELGRFEDGSNSIICDACVDTQILDVQFQFMYNGITFANGAFGNTISGGMLQDNVSSSGEVVLMDSSHDIDVSSMDMYSLTCCGGPLFFTATGYTGNNISVEGGEAYNFNPSNFTNGAPSAYKQDVKGWQKSDTTQSNISVTSTGGVALASTAARAGTSLDLGATTSPMVFPAGSTGSRPTTPLQGMVWNNASTGYPETYTSGWNEIFPSPPGYINGMTPLNDTTTPNTVIDITAGSATSDDGLTNILNSFAYEKTTGSWAVGWGSGCLDTGSIGASSWYAVFAIERTDTSLADYLCSLSFTVPKMPANYTKKRRIGEFKTDGSSNILSYVVTQKANGVNHYDLTADPTLDVSTTSLGATASTFALNVPTGIQVTPTLEASISNTTTSPVAVYISSLSEADLAPTTTSPFSGAPGYSLLLTNTSSVIGNSAVTPLLTSTTGSIRARASQAGTSFSLINRGFDDCVSCNYSLVGNIAIDGISDIAATTTQSTATLTLSTISGNDVIIVTQPAFNNSGISAISDTTSLSWVDAYTTGADGNAVSFWYAISPLPYDGTISLTMTSTGVSYSQAIGVSGANTTTPVDPHSGLPAFTSLGFGSYSSISTTPTTSKARDLVINVFSGHGVEFGPAPIIPTGYNSLIPVTGVNGTPAFAEWYGSTTFSYISAPLAGGAITYSFPQNFSLANMLTVPIQASGQ